MFLAVMSKEYFLECDCLRFEDFNCIRYNTEIFARAGKENCWLEQVLLCILRLCANLVCKWTAWPNAFHLWKEGTTDQSPDYFLFFKFHHAIVSLVLFDGW